MSVFNKVLFMHWNENENYIVFCFSVRFSKAIQPASALNTEEGFLRFETVNLKLKQRFVVSSGMNCLEVICNKRD